MKDRLFHDQGYIYFSPLEPTSKDEVIIRLQSADELKLAYVLVREKGTDIDTEYILSYEKKDKTGKFHLWKGTIPAYSRPYHYIFKVELIDGNIKYFDVYGENNEPKLENGFYVIPDFSTPDWSKGAMWYSVLPDAFYNGDVLNDKTGEFRDAAKGAGDIHPFCSRYGGDIRGIIKKLDYIKDMNADAVFINPLWVCKDSAGYGPDNFDMLDTAYGTDEELCELIDEIHKRNLKIMLDAVVVFSTTHSNLCNLNKEWHKSGALTDKDSDYYDYFHFKHWPDSYQNYFASLLFDYSKDCAKDYIYRNEDSHLQRYLKAPYGIDAWRFDSADLLWGQDLETIEVAADIRKYLKPINSDMLFLSESYHAMDDGVWDTCWNMHQLFNLREWMMEKYDINFFLTKTRMFSNARCRPLALSLYTHFDNHDLPRLYPLISEKARLFSGIIWYMTYIGSPTLFYGDETGDKDMGVGHYHSFNWNTDAWDTDFYYLYKTLCEIRKKYPLFRKSIVRVNYLDNDNEIISFGRFDESGAAVTVLNPHNEKVELEIEVDVYEIIDGEELTDIISGRKYIVRDGKVSIIAEIGGAVLIKNCTEDISSFADKKKKRFISEYVSNEAFVSEKDWSYSFETDNSTLNMEYGIYVGENELDSIYVSSRRIDDIIKLCFGRIVGGKKVPIYESVANDGKVTIQLQRISTRYSAFYKLDDGEWKLIGDNLPAAFGETHIGILDGREDGIISNGFGNLNCGGKSLCTPICLDGFDGDWTPLKKTTELLRQKVINGKFDYINGGLLQSEKSGKSILCYDRAVNQFRMSAILSSLGDKGECGFFFGADKDGNGGYHIALKNGKISLANKEKVIFFSESYGEKLILECLGKKTIIYSGKNNIPVFCEEIENSDGYVGYYSIDTSYKLLNYAITDLSPAVSQQNIFWEINGNELSYNGTGSLGIKGKAYTRFSASVDILFKEEKDNMLAGILFSDDGCFFKNGGLLFAVTQNGKVQLRHGKEILIDIDVQVTDKYNIEISGNEGSFSMSVNGKHVFDYDDSEFFGGSLAVASENANVVFSDFNIIL